MNSEYIIEFIKTKLMINDYIYVFQKELGDGLSRLRYTRVQRKEHCIGSVTTNIHPKPKS